MSMWHEHSILQKDYTEVTLHNLCTDIQKMGDGTILHLIGLIEAGETFKLEELLHRAMMDLSP